MKIIKAVKKPIQLEFMEVIRDIQDIKDLITFGQGKITKGSGGVYVNTNEGALFTSYGSFIAKGYSIKLGCHFWPIDKDYFIENYKVVSNS
tara:strand:- start:6 stop:278 length:273 start_codon:yes stop_codon:yes gene_type:complete